MQKKKYKFNQTLWGMPPGFIMGDIKYAVLHQDNDVSEQGCIIGSGGEVAIITKDWEQDSKSSGIMSVPSNEVWFQTSDGEYYDPMYVQIEEEYGDTFPDLPTFDREKTQAANIGNGSIYKWVFTEDITRINDGSIGMFTEDDYYSTALPISKVFLPVNYWQNTSELESYLFLYCSDLESFAIPNSVTSIGSSAFSDCSSLTSITIPNSVTSIGDWAFGGCYSLTSVTIPNSVTSIGNGAFEFCSSLTSIAIPNSVTSIGEGAFEFCSSLTSIAIPNSVTSIGEGAFRDCSSLTSIVVETGNTTYDSRDNCNAIIETATNTLVIGCKNTIIPNSVTSIGDNAFSGCYSLSSITIPESVTSIGYMAFSGCSALTSVTIGNSVTSIGAQAFSGCSSLTSIAIPNSVTSIEYMAFSGCSSLTSITIPNSVTSIGDYAFNGCSSLTSITCEATTPPTLGSGNNLSNVTAVYVPAESVEAYKTATNWSYYSDKIQAIL